MSEDTKAEDLKRDGATPSRIDELLESNARLVEESNTRGKRIQELERELAMKPMPDVFVTAFEKFWAQLTEEQQRGYLNKQCRQVISSAVRTDVDRMMRAMIKDAISTEELRKLALDALEKTVGQTVKDVVQAETFKMLRDPQYGLLERLRRDLSDTIRATVETTRTQILERLKGL